MSDPSLKYGISLKTTLFEHQALEEYGNVWCGGNRSLAARELIRLGLEVAKNQEGSSAKFRLKLYLLEQSEREDDKRSLLEGYIKLQQNIVRGLYNEGLEEILKEFAKEKGLPYPPDVTQLSIVDVDRDLNRTWNALKAIRNGKNSTTLRELMSHLSSYYSAIEQVVHLTRLKELGYVRFDEYVPNKPLDIELIYKVL